MTSDSKGSSKWLVSMAIGSWGYTTSNNGVLTSRLVLKDPRQVLMECLHSCCYKDRRISLQSAAQDQDMLEFITD
ncbi:uncharacterized protein J3R85_011052 [Psidium guajava]|nr:uncharacterized protein J3R85_011052 [Psidium guajava]